MPSEEDQAQEVYEGISRAMSEGSMWLNEIFRFDNRSQRLFGKRGPRVSKMEAFWAVLSFAVVALSLTGLFFLTGGQGPFFILCSIPAIIVWSALALWNGRKIANMSPLRRRTGEGTGVWFWMQIKRAVTRISFLFMRPVMYSRVVTAAGTNDGSRMVVDSIEWLGTAYSPRAPFPGENADIEQVPVALKPRGQRVALPRKRIMS